MAGDTGLTFTLSNEVETHTKTPANVKGDYLSVHHPTVAVPPARKRKSTSKTSATAAKKAKPAAPATAQPKPVRKRAAKKSAAAKIIPQSLDECGEADRALITMRDAGEEWKTIRERYTSITGSSVGTSTLPNRYARLKSNFTHLNPSDNPLLLLAKNQVEASFEASKWDLIARVVQQKGGDLYAGCVLQRQYKKLMCQQGILPPDGVRDRDFEVPALGE